MLLSIVSVCSFAYIGIKWPMGVGWLTGNVVHSALIISYYFSSSLIYLVWLRVFYSRIGKSSNENDNKIYILSKWKLQ